MDTAVVQERLAAIRSQLVETRAAVAAAQAGSQLESTGELVTHDDHLADAGSDTFDRESQASLLAGIDAELDAVDVAEGRLRAGRYDTCEVCGGSIGDARLQAVPLATRCLADQLQAELFDRSLRAEVLHGPAEAEATHNVLLLEDPDAPEPIEVAAEEGAIHVD